MAQVETKWHRILGVSAAATDSQIKAAYLKLSKNYHPDKHAGSTKDMQLNMERKMKDINAAYAALTGNDSTSTTRSKWQSYQYEYDPFTGESSYNPWVLPTAALVLLWALYVVYSFMQGNIKWKDLVFQSDITTNKKALHQEVCKAQFASQTGQEQLDALRWLGKWRETNALLEAKMIQIRGTYQASCGELPSKAST